MFIITKTIEGARELSKKLPYRNYANPYGWDQGWLDMVRNDAMEIEWWKGEQPPVFGDKLGFYQTGTVEELYQEVMAYVQPLTAKKKAVLAKIKSCCPSLTVEVFDTNPYDFWVRIYIATAGGSSSHPFDLLQPDIMELALGAEVVMVYWKQMQERYPALTFYPGTINGMSAYLERGNKEWSVSIRFTNTQTRFFVPMTDADKTELERLNAEALKPDTFFCTDCNSARPMSEYAGFHFARKLCKTHATPEWLKMAQAETYE